MCSQVSTPLHCVMLCFLLQTTAAMWAVLTPAQYAHLNVVLPLHWSVMWGAEVAAIAAGLPSAAVMLQLAAGKEATIACRKLALTPCHASCGCHAWKYRHIAAAHLPF